MNYKYVNKKQKMNLMLAVSPRIRALQMVRGISTKDFCERSEITRMMLHNYEAGKHFPNLLKLKNMADVLGVPISALTGEIDLIIRWDNWNCEWVVATMQTTGGESDGENQVQGRAQ